MDPFATTSLKPASTSTRGNARRGAHGAAAGAASDAKGASLAEALAMAGGGAGRMGVEVFEAEGCDFDLDAEQQLMVMWVLSAGFGAWAPCLSLLHTQRHEA